MCTADHGPNKSNKFYLNRNEQRGYHLFQCTVGPRVTYKLLLVGHASAERHSTTLPRRVREARSAQHQIYSEGHLLLLLQSFTPSSSKRRTSEKYERENGQSLRPTQLVLITTRSATAMRQPPHHALDMFVITPTLGKGYDVECSGLKSCYVMMSHSKSRVFFFFKPRVDCSRRNTWEQKRFNVSAAEVRILYHKQ